MSCCPIRANLARSPVHMHASSFLTDNMAAYLKYEFTVSSVWIVGILLQV